MQTDSHNTLRPVKVYKRTWPHGYAQSPVIEVIGEGVFHGWGVNYHEFESGPGNFTIAIVEMLDGKVKEIEPQDVVFIDKALTVQQSSG